MKKSVFILSVLSVFSLAFGYTAPGELSKFRPVLALSKLQAPESDTVAIKPFDVAEDFFHVQGDTYMQFQMRGEKKRSELRQMKSNGDKAEWDVDGSETLRAEIALPTPDPSMEEYTFLQVHCGEKPALRIVWRDEYDGHRDAIFATLRLNAEEEGEVERFYLGQRNSGTETYEVVVEDSKIKVKIGGNTVHDGMDASFWKGYPCYFKAGVYIQHSSDDDSIVARTKFRALTWP